MSKEKIYLWKDHSGRGEKPVTLKESNVRKSWDLKELDDENQMLLSYFLDNSDEGDIWTSGTETLEHIETKEIMLIDKQKSNEVLLNSRFERQEYGGSNWSVPVWKVPGKSKNGFDLYITDDNEDGSYYSLIDRDWLDSREESIEELITSHSLETILRYYEDNFVNMNKDNNKLMEKKSISKVVNRNEILKYLIDNKIDYNLFENSGYKGANNLDFMNKNTSVVTFALPDDDIRAYLFFDKDNYLDGFNFHFGRELDLEYKEYFKFDNSMGIKLKNVNNLLEEIENLKDKWIKDNERGKLLDKQIKWLENFIVKWDDAENNNDFLIEGRLQKEYDQFLMDNDLPELSADELLLDLKKINSLVGKELVWVDPETKIKKSDKKIIVESVGYNNKGDAFIVYGPSDGDINFLSKVEINKLIDGDFGNSHDEASFILLDEYNKINKEEKKTPFNDPYEFIEEFSGYLVGKKIVNEKGEKFTILDLEYLNDLVVLRVESENGEQHPEHLEKYKAFIDGEIVPGHVGYVGESYSLILQEDVKAEEKINQLDYKYYVVNSKTNKIRTGWEYKEDAGDAAKEEINYGQKDIAVFTKKTLKSMNIDPELNENWGSEVSDYSIIEEAVRFGVTEGDYDESWVSKYIDGYKNGKYNSVIKARLVYYLDHADKHFKGAITSSQIEKALKFKEIISRVSDELLRIIKKDA